MNKSAFVLALLAALLLSCSSYAAYPMRVKDARGKNVTISAKPMRVVSLTPSNTEILYAVGLRGRLVGVTRFCDYPPAVKSKPKVGDMTASVEAVVALKPDLVIAHANLNDSAIRRLENLGICVFAIDPQSLAEVARDIRVIGRIVARPATADSVAKQIERTAAEVKTRAAKHRHRRALAIIQTDPFWVAGPKTFVDEMLRLAGATNVAHDARPGFNPFAKELAISRDPEVILVGRASEVNYFTRDPAWKHTSAVRNKRVYVVDHDLLVRAGPRLAEGLRRLASRLEF